MLRSVDFHGLRAVEFSKGDYTALVIPEIGANLVRLCHTGLGAEILRTPAADEIETFRRRPQVFGMPLLFPPNRIADGRYEFDGRTYRFPITIEKEHNYHHGILKKPAVRRVEGMGDRRGDARGMPLLLERRERRRVPRLPARVQVQVPDLPPHAPRHGGRGDVRQPQPAADARRRGFSYADADPLRRRRGGGLRDARGRRRGDRAWMPAKPRRAADCRSRSASPDCAARGCK